MSLILAHVWDNTWGKLARQWFGRKHYWRCENGHAWRTWYAWGPYPRCPECRQRPLRYGRARNPLRWPFHAIRRWAELRALDRLEKEIERFRDDRDYWKFRAGQRDLDSQGLTTILRAFDDAFPAMQHARMDVKIDTICHALILVSDEPVRATTRGW